MGVSRYPWIGDVFATPPLPRVSYGQVRSDNRRLSLALPPSTRSDAAAAAAESLGWIPQRWSRTARVTVSRPGPLPTVDLTSCESRRESLSVLNAAATLHSAPPSSESVMPPFLRNSLFPVSQLPPRLSGALPRDSLWRRPGWAPECAP